MRSWWLKWCYKRKLIKDIKKEIKEAQWNLISVDSDASRASSLKIIRTAKEILEALK